MNPILTPRRKPGRPPKTKNKGFILIPSADRIDRHHLKGLSGPEPSGIILDQPRLAPAANTLPPEELERRISLYSARAAERKPLFHDGPAAPPEGPQCSGCGVAAPQRTHMGRYGWAVIDRKERGGGLNFYEMYCPECA